MSFPIVFGGGPGLIPPPPDVKTTKLADAFLVLTKVRDRLISWGVFPAGAVVIGRPNLDLTQQTAFPFAVITYVMDRQGSMKDETSDTHLQIVTFLVTILVQGDSPERREAEALALRARLEAIRGDNWDGLCVAEETDIVDSSMMGPTAKNDKVVIMACECQFAFLVDNVAPNRVVTVPYTQASARREPRPDEFISFPMPE